MVDMWKSRNPPFPRRRWKSFPRGELEIEKVEAICYFQISTVMFMDITRGCVGGNDARPVHLASCLPGRD